ncbi:MAG: hypothetical protein JJW03_06230 [Desulfosarcina sp.]|nr:hypothetical protein [Desulfobacterales bacterium]
MGSKRTWKRQHVFFYIACCLILIFVFTGCAYFPGFYPNKKSQGEKYLANAAELMEKGDYEASLAETEKVLSLFSKSFVKTRLKTEALLYGNLLREIIDRNKEIKKLGLKIKSLETERMAQKKDTDKLRNKQKDLHARLKKLKDRIKGLQNQIKDLKEIDLSIEEKKRESLDR